jgi:heme exporter protein C
MIRDLANPTRFMRLSGVLLPWLSGAAALLLAIGLYLVWFGSPADYQQGETVRIMYVHVPAAWLGLFFYMIMAASALGTIVWRHPLADVSQKSAAPIGAAFTLLGLALHMAGMRTEILRRRVRTLTILEAERLDAQAA